MTSGDELQQRLRAVRHEIDEDVDGLVQEAKSLVDWRDHVRNHPWAALGVAAAVGYLLIPKRGKNRTVEADQEMVAEMMNSGKVVMAPNAQVRQVHSRTGSILSLVGGLVLRSVANQVGRQFASRIADAMHGPKDSAAGGEAPADGNGNF